MILTVCGFDPSLRNWGWVVGIYNTETNEIRLDESGVISPLIDTDKSLLKKIIDIDRAYQLYEKAFEVSKHCDYTFVETPTGSQTSRAAVSYGICIGILASMRFNGINFISVEADDVKRALTGSKVATKKQMIDSAVSKYPDLNWPTYSRKGSVLITESIAEHVADAVGALHAGINSNYFKNILSLYKGK